METPEGFFFCLVGDLHPPDRYTAYLKYTLAATGRWARGQVVYRRELPYYHVRNVARTIEFLEREHPKYVWDDPVRNVKFSFVPRDAVARYRFEDGRSVPSMELISHEGLFCSVAEVGDRVRARGMLEQIDGNLVRLVVGTAALPDGGAIWRIGRGAR